MNQYEEAIGEELLEQMRVNVKAVSEETMNKNILPAIKDMFSYKGEVESVATVRFSFVEKEGELVIMNNVSFNLKFANSTQYDPIETVNQMLISEMFIRVLNKQV